MDVYWIAGGGLERRGVDDLPVLLARRDGFVWLDVPACDGAAARVLAQTFGFHAHAVRECQERSQLPKLHVYADHFFIVLQAPLWSGAGGHVHYTQCEQFVSLRYLVTVHGPVGAAHHDATLEETRAVAERISSGRFHPREPGELGHAIVSGLARRMSAFVESRAREVAALERRVLEDDTRDAEAMLESLFRVRHELLTVRTLAVQSREVYARMASFTRGLSAEAQLWVQDLLDQFDRLRNICESEQAFLQGVLDFYQSRTSTRMNIAMERLALMTAVVLPITALASIYGMNVIVNEDTRYLQLLVVLALMVCTTTLMLWWAKRQGWW